MIIKSTNGINILVDIDDYAFLKRHNWYVDEAGYVSTRIARTKIYMHVLIYGTKTTNHVIDHKNRNKLDNRKENLRQVTAAQNNYNKSARGTNKYIGVSAESGRKFRAGMSLNSRNVFLGYFESDVEAAKMRDAFAYAARGEYAALNFPENIELYKNWKFDEKLQNRLDEAAQK